MEHRHHTAADFAQDPSFQKWVLQQDQEAHTYWSKWLLEHPEKEEEVRHAIALMGTLEFGEDIDTNTAFIGVWQNIERKTLRKTKQKYSYLLAAACTGILIICSFLYMWLLDEPDLYTFSAEDSSTTYVLPDSSTIMLNANSQVKYMLNSKGDRELWLEGEAYFEVKRRQHQDAMQPSSFTVHTDNADIEVLGTAFNLYEDQNKTQVVLTHGKVKVTTNQSQAIYLQPGEFAEVKAKEPAIKKKQVDTNLYISWTSKKIKFDQTPLSEIAYWIEDRYDKKVLIPNSMDTITFSATLPQVNLELLLEAIKLTYQVQIEINEDVIIIKDI
ncbi:FecR family protein [Catalinimonas niigatensis]|uniref:FecR family protein n=1 Tax=Catalinimonas niigatensis TaxID=1397264 RepID=UPI00266644F6|nr:FecR domain-containing protein [Catalinimonas niigatensis]WPP49721.1 FecR domain-containing protein [Catalinimonas niigatensis]